MSSKSNGSSSKRSQGFSLVELMVAITILGVLLAIALPGFQSFVTQNRLTAQINELVGDLSFARNQAGARGVCVSVCIAASSTTCESTGTDWAAGRLIYVDINCNGNPDASNNVILKYVQPLDGGVTLITAGPTLRFRPAGGPGSNWTFKLCSPGVDKGRKITVPFSGRATAKSTDSTDPCT